MPTTRKACRHLTQGRTGNSHLGGVNSESSGCPRDTGAIAQCEASFVVVSEHSGAVVVGWREDGDRSEGYSHDEKYSPDGNDPAVRSRALTLLQSAGMNHTTCSRVVPVQPLLPSGTTDRARVGMESYWLKASYSGKGQQKHAWYLR